jgi:hypothetical protein
MDAPEALVRFARKAAAFDFPQMRDGNESETNADYSEESAGISLAEVAVRPVERDVVNPSEKRSHIFKNTLEGCDFF